MSDNILLDIFLLIVIFLGSFAIGYFWDNLTEIKTRENDNDQ